MVKIILIRHGFSEYNKLRKYSGQLDVALDEIGKQQAKDTADFILKRYKVDAVYSSDLSRAVSTVQPIADTLKLDVIKKKELREIDVGLWHDLGFEEAREKFPETAKILDTDHLSVRYDGGESYKEVMERMLYTLDEILEKHNGKTIAIASHNGSIKALFAAMALKGIMPQREKSFMPNASISVFDYDGKNAEFELMGYNGHLNRSNSETKVV